MVGKPWLVGGVGLVLIAASVHAEPYTATQLAGMSWCQLEQLYRQAEPGPLPCGFMHGRVVYPCDAHLAGLRTRTNNFMWQGKHFQDGCLINQFRGIRLIEARIYEGDSWLDGQPAHILDYQHSSHVWRDVRDEMRQICPGVYLGAMYIRSCPHPYQKVFFILDSGCCK